MELFDFILSEPDWKIKLEKAPTYLRVEEFDNYIFITTTNKSPLTLPMVQQGRCLVFQQIDSNINSILTLPERKIIVSKQLGTLDFGEDYKIIEIPDGINLYFWYDKTWHISADQKLNCIDNYHSDLNYILAPLTLDDFCANLDKTYTHVFTLTIASTTILNTDNIISKLIYEYSFNGINYSYFDMPEQISAANILTADIFKNGKKLFKRAQIKTGIRIITGTSEFIYCTDEFRYKYIVTNYMTIKKFIDAVLTGKSKLICDYAPEFIDLENNIKTSMASAYSDAAEILKYLHLLETNKLLTADVQKDLLASSDERWKPFLMDYFESHISFDIWFISLTNFAKIKFLGFSEESLPCKQNKERGNLLNDD